MEYYIARGGDRKGPYTQAEVEGYVNSGMVSATDLAWRSGEPDWRPLGELVPGLLPPPIPAASYPQAYAAAPQPYVASGPQGVGGWLLFYCIALTVLGPLLSIFGMLSGWSQAAPAFVDFPVIRTVMIVENLGVAAIVVYGFVVGCIVWSGSLQGKRVVKRFLIIRLVGFIVLEAVAILMMIGLPVEIVAAGFGGVIGAIVREGIYFAIWWLYFMKSVRVRNTYGA